MNVSNAKTGKVTFYWDNKDDIKKQRRVVFELKAIWTKVNAIFFKDVLKGNVFVFAKVDTEVSNKLR